MAPVTGRVTLDGEPLSSGRVVFYPVDAVGDVPASVGDIQTDGTYVLAAGTAGPGAWVGPHRVVVQGPEQVSFEGGSPQDTIAIPTKYGDFTSSGITEEVTSGENMIDIPLKSDPKYTPVTGTVTLNGQLLTGGYIRFHPIGADSGIRGATAVIQPDGTFAIPDPGLWVGPHRLAIAEGPDTPAEALAGLPEKYRAPETSDIDVDVSESDNVIDVALTSP